MGALRGRGAESGSVQLSSPKINFAFPWQPRAVWKVVPGGFVCVCVRGREGVVCGNVSLVAAFPGRALTGLFSTQVLGALLLPGYTIRRVSV